MGITDGKLLYCHGVAERNEEKKISTLEYNNRTFYDCFNNPFTADCGSPAMYLPPINIDDRPPPHKRARYAPNLLPDTIYVASENLLVPWLPLLICQISFLLMVKTMSMFWRKVCLWTVVSTEDTSVGYMVEFDATKRQGSIGPHAQTKTIHFITVRGFPVLL